MSIYDITIIGRWIRRRRIRKQLRQFNAWYDQWCAEWDANSEQEQYIEIVTYPFRHYEYHDWSI